MRKIKFKQSYKPLSEATPEEWRQAFKIASFWLTDELENCKEFGAFSEANLGESAIEYFPKRAYLALKDPNNKWHWKEGTKLSTLMINVMRSDMAHTLRDYRSNGEPLLKSTRELVRGEVDEDGFDDVNAPEEVGPEVRLGNWQIEAELEKMAELQRYESERDKGMRIARAAARKSGDPRMVTYVELAFKLPDYRSISKRMKLTVKQVKELETSLIESIDGLRAERVTTERFEKVWGITINAHLNKLMTYHWGQAPLIGFCRPLSPGPGPSDRFLNERRNYEVF